MKSKTYTYITPIISISMWLLGCQNKVQTDQNQGSHVASEVDSFTPRSMTLDPPTMEKSRAALDRIDQISNIYIDEALAWAARQPHCSSRCMAYVVSETLAASVSVADANKKLAQIERDDPYERWDTLPQFPGWRGYLGAIEPLISKGKTTDGRFTLTEGVLHLSLKDSIFRGIDFKDSPGSFLEVGAILPYDMPKTTLIEGIGYASGERLFVGSDKFGHFLSTGYEYLEAYMETYDKTKAAKLTDQEAEKRAHFATLVRGLLSEATVLGGWTSRIFSFGDLSANYDGFQFFKAIIDGKSPYFVYNKTTNNWSRGPAKFTWRDFITPAWDEGINCSHAHLSLLGDNHLQQQFAEQIFKISASMGTDVSCPALEKSCHDIIAVDTYKFGQKTTETLISPTCREQVAGKQKHIFTADDLNRDSSHYDQIGFYSGENIKSRAQKWCQRERDAMIDERCQDLLSTYRNVGECRQKLKKVTSEGFRCAMDSQDFIGWIL